MSEGLTLEKLLQARDAFVNFKENYEEPVIPLTKAEIEKYFKPLPEPADSWKLVDTKGKA
jgi:hypothetical protein